MAKGQQQLCPGKFLLHHPSRNLELRSKLLVAVAEIVDQIFKVVRDRIPCAHYRATFVAQAVQIVDAASESVALVARVNLLAQGAIECRRLLRFRVDDQYGVGWRKRAPRRLRACPNGTTDDTSMARGFMRYIMTWGSAYVPSMAMVPELRQDRPGRNSDQSASSARVFPQYASSKPSSARHRRPITARLRPIHRRDTRRLA
jgi:hypothetical protein